MRIVAVQGSRGTQNPYVAAADRAVLAQRASEGRKRIGKGVAGAVGWAAALTAGGWMGVPAERGQHCCEPGSQKGGNGAGRAAA